MSTLIVQLPARDPAVASGEWQLPDLPFVLLDRQERVMRSGRAALAMLPQAHSTVLMFAARDVLLLQLALPPLKGARLAQALPNAVEDMLIQDAQTCHLALDPQMADNAQRVVAAIDRGWFRFVFEAFRDAGHAHLRAVPILRCLTDSPTPAAAAAAKVEHVEAGEVVNAITATHASQQQAEPVIAAILGQTLPTALSTFGDDSRLEIADAPLELALARGLLGQGMALSPQAAVPTLLALAGDAPLQLYRLTEIPGGDAAVRSAADALPQARSLPFETLARRALACRFDLCQFEFADPPLRLSRATLQRWRLPLWLAAAALVCAVLGNNLDWWMLSHQYGNLAEQQTELLLATFPKTGVVLDPPVQMTHELDRLRRASGALAPDDFLALCNALSRALAPVAPGSIAQLAYRDHSLRVTFNPKRIPDDAVIARLRGDGLTVRQDGASWIIGSHA